ncbi:hypothetical protein BH09ACT10_BH09ACT10_14760 [soil metagenome]
MITHVVSVRLSDKSQVSFAAGQMRKLAACPSVASIVVGENLGLTPTSWDIVIVTQHDNIDQLAEFRADEYHKELGRSIIEYVDTNSSVDFDSGDAVTVV